MLEDFDFERFKKNFKKNHKALCNDEGEAYEFELKPTNGKCPRYFYLCRYCGVLFDASAKSPCVMRITRMYNLDDVEDFT